MLVLKGFRCGRSTAKSSHLYLPRRAGADRRERPQVNLNSPPMMFFRKSGSEPPVGVVRLTKSSERRSLRTERGGIARAKNRGRE